MQNKSTKGLQRMNEKHEFKPILSLDKRRAKSPLYHKYKEEHKIDPILTLFT